MISSFLIVESSLSWTIHLILTDLYITMISSPISFTIPWIFKYPVIALYHCIKYNILFPPSIRFSFTTRIDKTSKVHSRVNICGSSLGKYSYICSGSRLVNAKIGAFTSIGSFVECFYGNHPLGSNISSSPIFSLSRNELGVFFGSGSHEAPHSYVDSRHVVEIGSDVWIGSHVKILDGIKIGDGAVIGLGSIVTKDVEPYSIVAGVPAKVIGFRFKPEHILCLLHLKWWNKPLSWIKQHSISFSDPQSFFDDIAF